MSFGFQEFLPQDLWEIQSQWPVLASLAIIEILLSADNLIEVSSIAAHLPLHQRLTAIRLGVLGAFVARGVMLVFAAPYIAQYPVIRFIGALYLIYLSTAHFTGNREREPRGPKEHWSFTKTLLSVLCLDLALSIDNIVAAVSLSKKLGEFVSSSFSTCVQNQFEMLRFSLSAAALTLCLSGSESDMLNVT
jgi:predicted tellurium resistance membrane protein TerC